MAMHDLTENLKVTEGLNLFLDIPPIDGDNTTQPVANTTGWVSMAKYETAVVYCMVGVLGAGLTATFTVQEADSAIGGNLKTLGTKTQAVIDSDDGTVWPINVRAEELDIANGFTHIRVIVACSNHSALVGALIVRQGCRYPRATLPA